MEARVPELIVEYVIYIYKDEYTQVDGRLCSKNSEEVKVFELI